MADPDGIDETLHGEEKPYTERGNLTRRGETLHGEEKPYTERMNLPYRSSVEKICTILYHAKKKSFQ